VRDPDWQCRGTDLERRIGEAIGHEADCALVDAQALATALMGDAIFTNPFMLGFAWQRGWLPVRHESLMRAIELNGAAVQANQRAFAWGRAAAHDVASVRRAAFPAQVIEFKRASGSLAELTSRRVDFLTAYQNAAYARRYAELVERVRRVESDRLNGSTRLAEAVARTYFKLLAYKDEYEVARLHLAAALETELHARFGPAIRYYWHLHPPLLRALGLKKKIRLGSWFRPVFSTLSSMKGLRGTALDVFGYARVRREERALIGEYRTLVERALATLSPARHDVAVALADLPDMIRGYEDIKVDNVRQFRTRAAELAARLG